MRFTTALIATALAAASSVAALSPILPPNNPGSNGQQSGCESREECLTIINNVRASQEGLDPIKLPTNWDHLTYGERIFTFMNLERISRGLNPLTHMVNTFHSDIQTAITNDADPDPSSSELGAWESIWAGGTNMIPLAAIYGWMYYDGPGGYNLDCKGSDTSGCWGHRDAILCATVNKVDAGYGKDKSGCDGFAALFYSSDDTPSASETVLSWADEKTKCA